MQLIMFPRTECEILIVYLDRHLLHSFLNTYKTNFLKTFFF